MSKRNIRQKWIERHLVNREIKRDNVGSNTVLKKPDPMEIKVIKKDG